MRYYSCMTGKAPYNKIGRSCLSNQGDQGFQGEKGDPGSPGFTVSSRLCWSNCTLIIESLLTSLYTCLLLAYD